MYIRISSFLGIPCNTNTAMKFQNISICRIKIPTEVNVNQLSHFFKKLLGSDIALEVKTIFERNDAILRCCEVKNEVRSNRGKKAIRHEIMYLCALKTYGKSYGIHLVQQSSLWQKVVSLSDGKMPFQFAQYFLDEKQMNEITLDYLTGRYSMSSKLIIPLNEQFTPDKYCIIKTFTATIIDNHGKLKKILGHDYEYKRISVQTGHIKLPIKKEHIQKSNETSIQKNQIKPERVIRLIKYLERHFRNSKQLNWESLGSIRTVENPSLRNQLREDLVEEIFKYLKDPDKIPCFNPHSLLERHHRSFSETKKELLFQEDVIAAWEQRSISIKDAVDMVRKENVVSKSSQIDYIKVRLYETNGDDSVVVNFVDLIRATHNVEGNDESESCTYFQHNNTWYQINLDTFFQHNLQFTNVVKKCIGNENLPPLLKWNCDSKHTPTFTINDLYDFVKCPSSNVSKEELDFLEKLLTKKYIFYETESSSNLISGQYGNERHSYELLELNLKLMEKCKLKKNEEKLTYHSVIEESSETGSNEETTTVKNLKRYKVNVPHLPKLLVQDINDFNICIIRLMQYLRMHFFISQESEYNDLYHLSNCKCQQANSNWKYVVGDRITSKRNGNVELFDIMAFNENDNKVLLIHVKKGFDASAARALSSQVAVCGEGIFNGLYINPKRHMLKDFYNVAVNPKNDTDIHKNLTQQEVQAIAETEDSFFKKMISNKITFYICFAVCQGKPFSILESADLGYVFTESDFKESTLQFLNNRGILNNSKLTSKIFKGKKVIDNELCELDEKNIYENISKKVGGKGVLDFLADGSSFTAKSCLVDLYEKFSTLIFNERKQIILKIVDIPRC